VKKNAFVLAAMLAATPAFANNFPDGNVVVFGPGKRPCAEWTKAKDNRDVVLQNYFTSWATGFVSGIASASKDVNASAMKMRDSYVIDHWIDTYCLQHPKDLVYQAAGEFATKLADEGANQ